jgi:hypothetical protein
MQWMVGDILFRFATAENRSDAERRRHPFLDSLYIPLRYWPPTS